MAGYLKFVWIFLGGVFIYINDLLFFIKHSNVTLTSNSRIKLQCTMIASYHIIEKGLSMPNRRLGFGQEAILNLIRKCNQFVANYGCNDEQFKYAIGVIREYNDLHKIENFSLEKKTQLAIDEILAKHDYPSAQQYVFSRDAFFANVESNFEKFSYSRHSSRHFEGAVSLDNIKEALKLAQNAPSACNKQPIITYIVQDKNILTKILDFQKGNRGFGDSIDKIIVVMTRYSGCTRYSDRFYPFIDAGIYCMNVLYALHFKKLGAIPLIWLSDLKRDNYLRTLIGANNDEVPCLIIGVGDVAGRIICPKSPRRALNETLKIV